MENYIKSKIISINQNIGTFFITKLTPKTLYLISNKNLARVNNPDFGIQREQKESKIFAIKEYLKLPDAAFPNNIIIAIQNDPLELSPSYILNIDEGTIEIKLQDAVANILDGQHRLMSFDKNEESFELPVSIFLDLSLEKQAKIFAKINSTQTKVDLNLVYDLFGITKERSLEKVAFHLVEHLNNEKTSAWFKKVKTLTEKSGDIAQGSMAKFFHKELLEKHDVFKKLYKEERDTDIKNILLNFFNAVRDVFPIEWQNENKKFILTKTTGFNGFMLFLSDLVKIANQTKVPLSVEYFKNYIIKVRDLFESLDSTNYPPGAIGQTQIKEILRKSLSDEEKNILNIK